MHSILKMLLLLSTLVLHANGVSLNMPGQKLPLAKRTHRIPRTLQDPSFYKRGANAVSSFEKRGTLETRQDTDTCPAGTASCPSGGCCDGPCCGSGCCPAGFDCQFVGTIPGCCPTATTCSNQISGCADAGYVECTGFEFCCPPGQACSLDAAGNNQCNGITVGNGDPNTVPPPSNSSSPASPFISSTPTPDVSSTPTPDAGGNTPPTFESITPTTPVGIIPVTTSNPLTTTTAKGATPSSNVASARFEADRTGFSAMVLVLFGGLMGI